LSGSGSIVPVIEHNRGAGLYHFREYEEGSVTGFSEVLDVAIGLTFVFALLSVIATWVQELWATARSYRANDLVKTMQRFLDPSVPETEAMENLKKQWAEGVSPSETATLKDNALQKFYGHPMIKTLARKKGELPSYISPKEFSLVFAELLAKAGAEAPAEDEGAGDQNAEDADTGDSKAKKPAVKKLETAEAFLVNLKKGLDSLPESPNKQVIQTMVTAVEATEQEAAAKVVAVRKDLENWYDATMDRATAWYKRRAQIIAFIIGLLLAVLFNADTISLTQRLWQDPGLRSAYADEAAAWVARGDEAKAIQAREKLEAIGLPIGWDLKALLQSPAAEESKGVPTADWILKILGLLITGFLISFGSPFWFDLLSQFVSLRNIGSKPLSAAQAAGGKSGSG
jgi:hypothetical protein